MLIGLRFTYPYFVIVNIFLYYNELLYSKAVVSVGDLVLSASDSPKSLTRQLLSLFHDLLAKTILIMCCLSMGLRENCDVHH